MSFVEPLIRDIGLFAMPALFNVYFAGAAIPIGFVFAIFLALGKNSPNLIVNRLSRGYIYFFRGSPFFIQLFAFYSLVLAFNLSLWKPLGIDGFILHPLFLGPLILGLNTTAYTNEVVFLFQATALVYFTLPVIADQRELMNMAEVMFQHDYNVFLHFGTAALYFLVISLVIFYLFGLIYRRLMRHMPQEKKIKFSWRRVQGLS